MVAAPRSSARVLEELPRLPRPQRSQEFQDRLNPLLQEYGLVDPLLIQRDPAYAKQQSQALLKDPRLTSALVESGGYEFQFGIPGIRDTARAIFPWAVAAGTATSGVRTIWNLLRAGTRLARRGGRETGLQKTDIVKAALEAARATQEGGVDYDEETEAANEVLQDLVNSAPTLEGKEEMENIMKELAEEGAVEREKQLTREAEEEAQGRRERRRVATETLDQRNKRTREEGPAWGEKEGDRDLERLMTEEEKERKRKQDRLEPAREYLPEGVDVREGYDPEKEIYNPEGKEHEREVFFLEMAKAKIPEDMWEEMWEKWLEQGMQIEQREMAVEAAREIAGPGEPITPELLEKIDQLTRKEYSPEVIEQIRRYEEGQKVAEATHSGFERYALEAELKYPEEGQEYFHQQRVRQVQEEHRLEQERLYRDADRTLKEYLKYPGEAKPAPPKPPGRPQWTTQFVNPREEAMEKYLKQLELDRTMAHPEFGRDFKSVYGHGRVMEWLQDYLKVPGGRRKEHLEQYDQSIVDYILGDED